MLCSSRSCKKYNTCAWADINNVPSTIDNIVEFDRFGSNSYSYDTKTNKYIITRNIMCDNYSQYLDIRSSAEDILNDSEQEEQEQNMDNLDVCARIYNYIQGNDHRLTLETGKKVLISSVSENDNLVQIEYKDIKIIVKASELTKAIEVCSKNRW